jgi:hypothetical protein
MRTFRVLVVIFLFCITTYAQGGMGPGPGTKSYASAPATPYILTQTLGTPRNDFSGCVGFILDATANNTVSELGAWKISGGSTTHLLALVHVTGGPAIIGSCTVNFSGASVGYNYCSITPAALVNGDRYYILGQTTASGDSWYNSDTTINTVTAGIGTVPGFVYTSNSDCTGAYNTSGGGPFFPTNFKIQ